MHCGASLRPQNSTSPFACPHVRCRRRIGEGLDGPFAAPYPAGMYELHFVVPPELAGRRLSSVALSILRLSQSQLRRLKFQEGLYVNDALQHSDYRVCAGDRLRLVFRREGKGQTAPSDQPLAVVYEDEDLLVVDKPAPLPSLHAKRSGETLENRVFSYLGTPPGFVYRPINRLDKGTSGLMLIAKNAHAQQLIQRQLRSGGFGREYIALCCGRPPEQAGSIALPIGRVSGIKRGVMEGGKPALTDYRLLVQEGGLSLLGLRLHTGRTHQIRVHLSHIGCPILGDFLYGSEDARLPRRFALHACALGFRHPFTGEALRFCSAPPKEMQVLMSNPPFSSDGW